MSAVPFAGESLEGVALDLAALDRMREYLSADAWFAALELVHARLARHVEVERASLDEDE